MVFYQPKNGYCYNSDTHFLYNFICLNLEKYKNVKGEILDIGSGSGILGLLIAKKYNKLRLNQCEVQESFQFFSQKNALLNKIDANIYKGFYQNINFDKMFSMCISNPPFYHQNVIKSQNDSLKIARYNDFLPLKVFIEKTAKILNKDGKFFFCYDCKQLNEIIILLDRHNLNLEAIQFVYPNANKDASLVLIYCKKDSKSLMKVLNPLLVFDDNNKFTKKVQEIYKKTSTYSIKVDFE